MLNRTSIQRIEEILQYVNDFGETEACKKFSINIETLHRYMRDKKFSDTRNPQVILLDVETTPIETYVWHTYKQWIPHTSIIEPSFLLSWTAKQLFSAEVMSDVLTPAEALEKNDNRIVKSAWKVLESANVIIGHNVRKFDLRYLNTRFLMNNLKPPVISDNRHTRSSKEKLSIPSNKLDYLGTLIRNKGKLKTDFELWVNCLHGDLQALKTCKSTTRKTSCS